MLWYTTPLPPVGHSTVFTISTLLCFLCCHVNALLLLWISQSPSLSVTHTLLQPFTHGAALKCALISWERSKPFRCDIVISRFFNYLKKWHSKQYGDSEAVRRLATPQPAEVEVISTQKQTVLTQIFQRGTPQEKVSKHWTEVTEAMFYLAGLWFLSKEWKTWRFEVHYTQLQIFFQHCHFADVLWMSRQDRKETFYHKSNGSEQGDLVDDLSLIGYLKC